MDLFESIRALLIDVIPPAIASRKLSKPVAVLRLYYYDTHAPCMYLTLRYVFAESRKKVVARKGAKAPYYLWGSGENCGDGTVDLPEGAATPQVQARLASLFREVYALLCDDERRYMKVLRERLQGVARQLNGREWKSFCPVTDDFVIVPADGSVHFGDEYKDIIESVPATRLALLRERGYLGAAESWDQLP